MGESECDAVRFEYQTVIGAVSMAVLRQRLPFRLRMLVMKALAMHVRFPATRVSMEMVVHGSIGMLVHMRVERFFLIFRHGLLLLRIHRLYPL